MKLKKLLHSFILMLTLGCTGLANAGPELAKPFPPFRIGGNLYYVGNTFQASYLITTPQGNILINSDYKANVPMLKDSIEKLGFKFSDIKILLISHAHNDHDGGSALIKEQTGATYMVMDADVPVVESGGKADFHYSHDLSELYEPTKVDRVLHDGDKVTLGKTVLVAQRTPGHTKGCTTWTMKVVDKGKSYNVIIVGGAYVNPGFKLVHNTAYPTIAQDYEHMFQVLKSLPCDIFLGAHGMYFDLEKKYALMNKDKTNPFVDPKGYKKFITLKEQDFHNELRKQQAAN